MLVNHIWRRNDLERVSVLLSLLPYTRLKLTVSLFGLLFSIFLLNTSLVAQTEILAVPSYTTQYYSALGGPISYGSETIPIISGNYGGTVTFNVSWHMANDNNACNPGCCNGNSSRASKMQLFLNGVLRWEVESPNDDNTTVGNDGYRLRGGATGQTGGWPMQCVGASSNVYNTRTFSVNIGNTPVSSVLFTFTSGCCGSGEDDGRVRINSITAESLCNADSRNPLLSQTTISSTCPSGTVNLESITSSNRPSGTVLSWHTGTPATGDNRISEPPIVGPGTYYAAFFDGSNNCYGTGFTEVTVTSKDCTDSDGDNVPDVDDLDDDNDGIPDIVECPGEGVGTEFGTTISNIGVPNPTNANGDPTQNKSTGTHANMNESDVLTFDLGTTVPAGTIVEIHWNRFGTSSGPTTEMYVEQSTSSSTGFTNRADFSTTTIETDPVAIFSYALTSSARYIRVTHEEFSAALYGIQTVEANCDVDGDGIPNRLDLDSDEDGCADAAEAGHGQTVQADNTISGPYGNNGLANSVENNDSQTATINYTVENNSSGVPAFLDPTTLGVGCETCDAGSDAPILTRN